MHSLRYQPARCNRDASSCPPAQKYCPSLAQKKKTDGSTSALEGRGSLIAETSRPETASFHERHDQACSKLTRLHQARIHSQLAPRSRVHVLDWRGLPRIAPITPHIIGARSRRDGQKLTSVCFQAGYLSYGQAVSRLRGRS
jgi:hypothetical protein